MRDGLRRALRAWPMILLLTAFTAALAPVVRFDARLSAADLGLGSVPLDYTGTGITLALREPELSAVVCLAIAWVFLSGGVVDRLARDARSSPRGFFAACGATVLPLLRLAGLLLLALAPIQVWLMPATNSMLGGIVENGRVVALSAATLVVFAVALVFDYARVRLVIEDRRSAIGALLASLRFVRAHPLRTVGTQLFLWSIAALWVTLVLVPVYRDNGSPWLTVPAVGVFMVLKLALIGAQASTYQAALATAGWVARREPAWPDEPSADPAARASAL